MQAVALGFQLGYQLQHTGNWEKSFIPPLHYSLNLLLMLRRLAHHSFYCILLGNGAFVQFNPQGRKHSGGHNFRNSFPIADNFLHNTEGVVID